MAHIHDVGDSDLSFTINPTTRVITNQNTEKTRVIQYDHNSERFTFELPRFVDEHDMLLCSKIEIHYINISNNKNEKSEDVYEVKDIQVSPTWDDTVMFSWLLSQNATKYAGSLNFIVRFVCLTDDSLDYAWHTEIFKGISVSDGMNNGEAVILEYSDVLEAWKQEVLGEEEEILRIAREAAESAAESAQKAAECVASISVTEISGGHRVTTTDADGTETFDVLDGSDGRGITEIKRTSGNGAAGTNDTYTIYYTDGSTSTFNVYNGANGSGGGSTEGGENGATFTPHVDSSGNLSWTNDKGLPNPETVNIKGPAPVKGTDYFTASDKQELVSDVLAALPTWNGGSY